MRTAGISIVIAVLSTLSACGGSVDLTCDEVNLYQRAQSGKRIQPPDDLDELDLLKEIPLPKASPAASQPAGSPCINRPPRISTEVS